MKKFNKLYNVLTFTWGIFPNVIAAVFIVPIFTLVFKIKKDPVRFETRYGRWVFIGGDRWGGLSMGNFIFMAKSAASGAHTIRHEIGHSLQNILWGPLWLFVVGIPSFLRYWYRETPLYKKKTNYDDIWFEGQATAWGTKYVEAYEKSEEV